MRITLLSVAAIAAAAAALVQPVAAATAAENVCKLVPAALVKAAARGKKVKTAKPTSYIVKPTTTSACQWSYVGGTITAAIRSYSDASAGQVVDQICAGQAAVANVGERACLIREVTPGVKQATLYTLKGSAIVTASANVLGKSKPIASQAQLAAIAKALLAKV